MDGIAVIVVKRVDTAIFPNVFGASQNIIRRITPTGSNPGLNGVLAVVCLVSVNGKS
jgi:hypothetical protein